MLRGIFEKNIEGSPRVREAMSGPEKETGRGNPRRERDRGKFHYDAEKNMEHTPTEKGADQDGRPSCKKSVGSPRKGNHAEATGLCALEQKLRVSQGKGKSQRQPEREKPIPLRRRKRENSAQSNPKMGPLRPISISEKGEGGRRPNRKAFKKKSLLRGADDRGAFFKKKNFKTQRRR